VAKTQAIYYRNRHGREPVNDFIEGLDAKPAAKIDGFVEEHLNGRVPSAPPPSIQFRRRFKESCGNYGFALARPDIGSSFRDRAICLSCFTHSRRTPGRFRRLR
jgi:hypothetical protein